MVTFEVTPPVVGMPLREPVARPSISPLGRAPPIWVQVYGCAPPVALKLKKYGIPCPPVGNGELLVMVSDWAQSAPANASPQRCRRSVTNTLFDRMTGKFRTWWRWNWRFNRVMRNEFRRAGQAFAYSPPLRRRAPRTRVE